VINVINKWLSHEEIAQFISSLDVLVCAYRDGTQSGVVSAAYALGVPVIVSDSGGLPEQAGYGEYACVVKAGCSNSLLEGLSRVLNSPQTRMSLAETAKKYADQYLLWKALAKNLLRLINEGKCAK